MTTTHHDKNLIKRVHAETRGAFEITASISRFGGLSVFVAATVDPADFIWQGDNILAARAWADAQAERDRIALARAAA